MTSVFVVLNTKNIKKNHQYLLDKKVNFTQKPIKIEWGTSTIIAKTKSKFIRN